MSNDWSANFYIVSIRMILVGFWLTMAISIPAVAYYVSMPYRAEAEAHYLITVGDAAATDYFTEPEALPFVPELPRTPSDF